MQRYAPNGFNFNLTWNDYKNGFGSSDSGDFWLGWRASKWNSELPNRIERLHQGQRTSGWVWSEFTF